MRYQPLANRVIMREVHEDKTTRGGLWVPDIARRNKGLSYGEVIAVGPGRLNAEGKLVPVHVKVGDVVCFPRQAPAVMPLVHADGTEEDVLMCPENDIIAVVHDLPRQSLVMGIDGAPLSIEPSSLALPDGVYKNREDLDRSVSDLKQVNAPPDVIADAQMADQLEHEVDATEQ